jgi:hypothetical protein
MVGLAAYAGGGPLPHLLQRLTQAGSIQSGSINIRRPQETMK